jgi:hypothetical protein
MMFGGSTNERAEDDMAKPVTGHLGEVGLPYGRIVSKATKTYHRLPKIFECWLVGKKDTTMWLNRKTQLMVGEVNACVDVQKYRCIGGMPVSHTQAPWERTGCDRALKLQIDIISRKLREEVHGAMGTSKATHFPYRPGKPVPIHTPISSLMSSFDFDARPLTPDRMVCCEIATKRVERHVSENEWIA